MYKIDIIIPVYLGYIETKRCITSVLKTIKNNKDIRVIVLNDKSPDPNISEFLQYLSYKKKIILLNNKKNYGFTKTVNIGIRFSRTNDVIILNSDTEVANDWFKKLRWHAYSKKNIGTVTPMSNNATICSYPKYLEGKPPILKENPIGISTSLMDKFFFKANKKKNIVTPSSVGFCMFLTRESLKINGLFDYKTFKMGYGEENDFSCRCIENGYTNLIALDTYIFHEGSTSFKKIDNSISKRKLRFKNALKILLKKHPNFNKNVSKFIKENKIDRYNELVTIEILKYIKKKKVLFFIDSDEISNKKINDNFYYVLFEIKKNIKILRFYRKNKKDEFAIESINIEILKKILSCFKKDEINFTLCSKKNLLVIKKFLGLINKN